MASEAETDAPVDDDNEHLNSIKFVVDLVPYISLAPVSVVLSALSMMM